MRDPIVAAIAVCLVIAITSVAIRYLGDRNEIPSKAQSLIEKVLD